VAARTPACSLIRMLTSPCVGETQETKGTCIPINIGQLFYTFLISDKTLSCLSLSRSAQCYAFRAQENYTATLRDDDGGTTSCLLFSEIYIVLLPETRQLPCCLSLGEPCLWLHTIGTEKNRATKGSVLS